MRVHSAMLFFVVHAALGCSSESRPLVAPAVAASAAPRPAPPTDLERARAYERGAGVARDYAQAAAIYDRLCADGKGELAACHPLLDAMHEQRGVAMDRCRAIVLTDAMCERDDLEACVTLEFITDDTSRDEELGERLQKACDAHDVRACEIVVGFRRMTSNGSSGAEEKTRRLAHEVCVGGGSMDTCGYVVQTAYSPSSDDARDALEILTRACKAGDAAACAQIPGHEIADDALCAAHDQRACARLGHPAAPATEDPRYRARCGEITMRAVVRTEQARAARRAARAASERAAATAPPAAPTPPSTQPTTGTVKFVVEPADATIKIAGMEAHRGSPYQLQLEPGQIMVIVDHRGYKQYVTTVDLSAGETQTIRVVLEHASP